MYHLCAPTVNGMLLRRAGVVGSKALGCGGWRSPCNNTSCTSMAANTAGKDTTRSRPSSCFAAAVCVACCWRLHSGRPSGCCAAATGATTCAARLPPLRRWPLAAQHPPRTPCRLHRTHTTAAARAAAPAPAHAAAAAAAAADHVDIDADVRGGAGASSRTPPKLALTAAPGLCGPQTGEACAGGAFTSEAIASGALAGGALANGALLGARGPGPGWGLRTLQRKGQSDSGGGCM
eukprot:1151995-Pelagomonas_calceolata.AAC.3